MTAQLKFGGRKTREGTVVSDKMEKTVVVAVETHLRHRLYRKIIRRIKRYMAHDEAGDCRLGDRVRIVESRPLSHRKRWRVVEVLIRGELPELAPEAIDLDLLGEVKVEEEAAQESPGAEEAPAEAPEVVAAEAEVAAEPEPEQPIPVEEAEAEPEAAVEAPPEAEAEVEPEEMEAEATVEPEPEQPIPVEEAEAEPEAAVEAPPEAEEAPEEPEAEQASPESAEEEEESR